MGGYGATVGIFGSGELAMVSGGVAMMSGNSE